MLNQIFDFKNKILFTIQILIAKINKKVLSIEKFEIIEDKTTLIYFYNNDTGKTYIKNVEWVFLNKKILCGFNNKEAAKIGCMYAKYVFYSSENE